MAPTEVLYSGQGQQLAHRLLPPASSKRPLASQAVPARRHRVAVSRFPFPTMKTWPLQSGSTVDLDTLRKEVAGSSYSDTLESSPYHDTPATATIPSHAPSILHVARDHWENYIPIMVIAGVNVGTLGWLGWVAGILCLPCGGLNVCVCGACAWCVCVCV